MTDTVLRATSQRRPTRRPGRGVALVLAAAVLFAVNGTVSKLILRSGLGATQLTTLRASGAYLGLFALSAAVPPGLRRLSIGRRELPLLITYGVVGFFGVPALYFVAISRLPVGIALLFQYTAPLLVALWARFVQRRAVRPRLWIGLALSLVGLAAVAQVGQGHSHLDGIGVLAGLGAAVGLMFYYLLGARGVARRDPLSLTWWAFGFSALAGMVIAPWWRFPFRTLGRTSGSVPVWLLVAYLVLGGSIAAYLLVNAALRHLPPTSVGILGMLEPVIASAVAWLVLGERLNFPQLAGGTLILIGVSLAETARTVGPGEGPELPPS